MHVKAGVHMVSVALQDDQEMVSGVPDQRPSSGGGIPVEETFNQCRVSRGKRVEIRGWCNRTESAEIEATEPRASERARELPRGDVVRPDAAGL